MMGGATSAAERAWTCAQQGRALELGLLLPHLGAGTGAYTGDASHATRAALQQALWIAACNNHADALHAIFANPHGARAVDCENVQQLTALWIACRHGCARAVSALLAAKAGVEGGRGSWFDGTPVCIAARGGHHRAVELLVNAKADVDTADATGTTPTHRAAFVGHSRMVAMLVAARADVGKVDVEGRTAMHWAASKGHVETVETLLLAKASVNCREKVFGDTPLHRALTLTRRGPFPVVQALTRAKADVDLADNFGRTPMYCAARRGMSGAVEIFLRAKADVDKTFAGGETPARKAAARGHHQVVEILMRAKAQPF